MSTSVGPSPRIGTAGSKVLRAVIILIDVDKLSLMDTSQILIYSNLKRHRNFRIEET